MPAAAPDPFRRRLAALRRRFAAARIDALLVVHPPDQFYLTGAVLEDSAVLVTGPKAVVITDSRFDEQVAQQAPWADKLIRRDSLADAAVRLLGDLKTVRRLGLDEHMPLGQFQALSRKARRLRLKPTRALVAAGRMIKDEHEIAQIRRALAAAQRAFRGLRGRIRAGMREREAAAELEYQMRLAGAAGAAFEPIVAVGPRASLPHARASETRLRAGRPVLFDWGARVGGYCCDLTRVILVEPQAAGRGHVRNKLGELHRIVLEAQQAGIAAVRPGARCSDVDHAARRIIERAGYGPQFGHGLGHGLGLEVHEGPRLGPKSKDVLRPGMVVTVEPGIYLPGVGGVRIEDDVLVTSAGCRVLSRLDKSLE